MLRILPRLALVAAASLFLAGESRAAFTVRFTNNEVNLGTSSVVQLTNQYAPFNLLFNNVYRYIDRRDPFSDAPNQVNGLNLGIAVGTPPNFGGIGTVTFITPVDGISFDWITLSFAPIVVNAFNGPTLVGSFQSPPGNQLSGTATINGVITHFTFSPGGSTAIANLTYDVGPAVVPEPASLTLLGIGIAGLAGYTIRRRRMACPR